MFKRHLRDLDDSNKMKDETLLLQTFDVYDPKERETEGTKNRCKNDHHRRVLRNDSVEHLTEK